MATPATGVSSSQPYSFKMVHHQKTAGRVSKRKPEKPLILSIPREQYNRCMASRGVKTISTATPGSKWQNTFSDTGFTAGTPVLLVTTGNTACGTADELEAEEVLIRTDYASHWDDGVNREMEPAFNNHSSMMAYFEKRLESSSEAKNWFDQFEKTKPKNLPFETYSDPSAMWAWSVHLMKRGSQYRFGRVASEINKLAGRAKAKSEGKSTRSAGVLNLYGGDHIKGMLLDGTVEEYFALATSFTGRGFEGNLKALASKNTPEGRNARYWYLTYLWNSHQGDNFFYRIASHLNQSCKDIQCPFRDEDGSNVWTLLHVKYVLGKLTFDELKTEFWDVKGSRFNSHPEMRLRFLASQGNRDALLFLIETYKEKFHYTDLEVASRLFGEVKIPGFNDSRSWQPWMVEYIESNIDLSAVNWSECVVGDEQQKLTLEVAGEVLAKKHQRYAGVERED